MTLSSLLDDPSIKYVSIITILYVSTLSLSIISWFTPLGTLFRAVTAPPSRLKLIIAWIPRQFFNKEVQNSYLSALKKSLPSNWTTPCSLYHAVNCGDPIVAARYVIPFLARVYGDSTMVVMSYENLPSYSFDNCLD